MERKTATVEDMKLIRAEMKAYRECVMEMVHKQFRHLKGWSVTLEFVLTRNDS